jgi:hypothetical protein
MWKTQTEDILVTGLTQHNNYNLQQRVTLFKLIKMDLQLGSSQSRYCQYSVTHHLRT